MQLIFATSNQHKVKEVHEIIPEIELNDLRSIGWDSEIPETENTLHGNAVLKARTVSDARELPCFSEDTGLEVDALRGAPGVYTARFASPNATAEENMEKLLKELEGVEDRSAQFRTVIALIIDDAIHTFEGIVRGKIAEKPAGDSGFGYDPIFIPEGETRTFAQMDDAEKNAISHRARATQQFVDFLRDYVKRKNP